MTTQNRFENFLNQIERKIFENSRCIKVTKVSEVCELKSQETKFKLITRSFISFY